MENLRTTSLLKGSEVRDSDIVQMAEMYAASFSEPPWNEVWPIAEARKTIENAIVLGRDFVLCRIGELILGYGIAHILSPDQCEDHQKLVTLGVSPESYYLSEILTHRQFRRQGVASSIIKGFYDEALKAHSAELSLRTREDNTAFFGVLKEMKFKEVARYEAMTGNVTSTRVVFSTSIPKEDVGIWQFGT